MNAAVWFGAAVFHALGVVPSLSSPELQGLIGTNNFPFFGFVISDLPARSFAHLYLACGIVAVVYLVAEWLYFGKYPPRRWVTFVLALVLIGCARGYLLQSTLRSLHQAQYSKQLPAEQRQMAARSFATWTTIGKSLDLILLAGLGFYVWRTANPSDPMRFVSASKFRG